MAIYFKCPNCGREVIDTHGEHAIDIDKVFYKCPYCDGKMEEKDIISYEEFIRLDEERITRELKEIFPITMLTESQIDKARVIAKSNHTLDAVKYIHTIIPDEGMKGAKAYYDLYIDERRQN